MTFQQTGQNARSGDKRHTGVSQSEWPGGKQDKGRWQQCRLERLDEERLARGLGWFSIGLGLAEVIAPQGLAKLIGVSNDRRVLLRMLGLREIASGIGILTRRRPAGWL